MAPNLTAAGRYNKCHKSRLTFVSIQAQGRVRAVEAQVYLEVAVDIVFLINFVTDLAWLAATASMAGVRARLWRLLAASAAGAAAAVWAYWPSGRWLTSGPGVVLGSVALLLLAFWPVRLRQGLRLAGIFILTGGAMAGIAMLTGARQGATALALIDPASYPGGLVSAGLLLCLVGARYLLAAFRERARLAKGLYQLTVTMGGREVQIPALMDTGNSLKDPLSGRPVVVVEARSLAGSLPPLVIEAVGAGWDAMDRLPPSWAARCRLVPFRAVGEPGGMLLAFAPDGLLVRKAGASDGVRVDGLVGLTGHRLHPEGAYRALLSPQILDAEGEVSGNAWEGETG